MDEIRILLVDDHRILIEGIRSMLQFHARFRVRDLASKGKQALHLLENNTYELLITDLQLPDLAGQDIIRAARKLQPAIKVLVLSMHDDSSVVRELIQLDIQGYILKGDLHPRLEIALDKIAEGGRYFSDGISEIMMQQLQTGHQPAHPLTPRELEILRLIVREHSTKEIAELLNISELTVETHRKNILRKTNCSGLVALVKYAYRLGLVEDGGNFQ